MVNALPFGATGSVSAFLRISMFLWFVGVVGLKLAWTSFYDDYTLVSREDCAKNTAWLRSAYLTCWASCLREKERKPHSLTSSSDRLVYFST